jgi:hypothetical protein
MPAAATLRRSVEQEPVYWFCRLDEALNRADEVGAERARSELEPLGVRVDYDPRPATVKLSASIAAGAGR